jgi:Spy/CpxP family protein refolding chaperone
VTPTLTSRRQAAGRSGLSPTRLLPTCLLTIALLALNISAHAQHGGGGRPRGMAGNAQPRGFNRPMPDARSAQPRMGLQLGLGGRWWDDHHTAHKLNLTSDQQHRMDDIFETNKPTLAALYTNLQHEEMTLATLSPSDLRDESKVFAAIDRVSHASSDLEKQNAHILLQIRQQLDPTQLQSLDTEIASTR